MLKFITSLLTDSTVYIVIDPNIPLIPIDYRQAVLFMQFRIITKYKAQPFKNNLLSIMNHKVAIMTKYHMLSPGVWRHLLLGPRLRLVGGPLVLAVLAVLLHAEDLHHLPHHPRLPLPSTSTLHPRRQLRPRHRTTRRRHRVGRTPHLVLSVCGSSK